MYSHEYFFDSLGKSLKIVLNTKEENLNFNYVYLSIAMKLFSTYGIPHPSKTESKLDYLKITINSYYGTLVFYTKQSDIKAFDELFYNEMQEEFKEYIVVE